MMLVPSLKKASPADQMDCLTRIQAVLTELGDDVLFADFNRDINVLWISHRCRQGVTLELCTAIRERVPEAKLIANQTELELGNRRRAWTERFRQSWLAAQGRRLLGYE